MSITTNYFEDKPIILIGFMGVGKTSIGKKLAKELQLKFIDTDKLIEKNEGLTISQIFEKHGEDYFRKCESNLLDEIKNLKSVIISVGGGLPCYHENMQKLKKIGYTIYLKKDPISLANHLKSMRKSRPLLNGLNDDELMSFVQEKLTVREKFYAQADFTVLTSKKTLDIIIEKITGEKLI